MSRKSLILSSKLIHNSNIPEPVLNHYFKIQEKISTKNWQNRTEQEIWQELCFCILSTNVNYELVKSVVNVLDVNGLLDTNFLLLPNSEQILFKWLNSNNFEPKKKNGELRKYRYPNRKSNQIVGAAKKLYSNNNIKRILSTFKTDIDARDYFIMTIPGLGIKEASHFLRNIGYSDSLAVIDIHMLNFLKKYSMVTSEKFSLTQRVYLKIETILKNLVRFHRLNMIIFDLAVWHHMRNL